MRAPRDPKCEIVNKIIHLQTNYHFGPENIQMYLERYHDTRVCRTGIAEASSASTRNHLPSF